MISSKKGKPILIAHIDDDEGFCQIVAHLLHTIAPNRYSIISFQSANEAFFQINSNPTFDIIISDFDMPEMSGLELFQNLHQVGIEIPFILLTGNRAEDLPIKAINMGIKFFVRKEMDFVPLLKQLDNLIRVTVANTQAQNELLENEKMITDFITVLTDNYQGINDKIYTHILFQNILKSFLEVSQSQFTFLNEIKKISDQEIAFSTNFLASENWSEEQGYQFKTYSMRQFPFKELEQYYTTVLLEKTPVLANSLEEDILNQQTDQSNTKKLTNFLGLPIFFNKTLVGVVGLINREQEYDEQLIFELQPFCINLANYMYLKMYIDGLKQKITSKDLKTVVSRN